jgi:hypothetical protein
MIRLNNLHTLPRLRPTSHLRNSSKIRIRYKKKIINSFQLVLSARMNLEKRFRKRSMASLQKILETKNSESMQQFLKKKNQEIKLLLNFLKLLDKINSLEGRTYKDHIMTLSKLL